MEGTLLRDIAQLVLVFVLVGLNGFFVSAEFALVSVRRTRIEELVAAGNDKASVVRKAIRDPDRFIAATQLGITIASLGLGWVGEPAFSHLIEPLVALVPESITGLASRSISAAISFVIITFLHVVIGELAPKSIALQYPEKTSLAVARPTIAMAWLFSPFIWALNGTGNWLLRRVGIETASGHSSAHSIEELRMIVEASTEEGILNRSEEQMLEAVFDFRKMTARHVLVPRTETIMLQVDQTLREVTKLDPEAKHSKYPVYKETPDHVEGILYIRDCLDMLAEGKLDSKVGDLMRDAVFVPETASILNVLSVFRQKSQHIAIVFDEYGGTAGLVTLEDILEEIAGTIPDVDESELAEIAPRQDGSTLVNGLTLIEDVNDHFDLEINDPNYDTIGGYVMGQLDRIPRAGDEITVEHVRFRVMTMDGKRAERLLVPAPSGDQKRRNKEKGAPIADGGH